MRHLFISYEFRVVNLASPNVMSSLRERYDMTAILLQAVPKAHHNLPQAIITHNLPKAIIVDFRLLTNPYSKKRYVKVHKIRQIAVFALAKRGAGAKPLQKKHCHPRRK